MKQTDSRALTTHDRKTIVLKCNCGSNCGEVEFVHDEEDDWFGTIELRTPNSFWGKLKAAWRVFRCEDHYHSLCTSTATMADLRNWLIEQTGYAQVTTHIVTESTNQ
jgi:hypothetical protein